MVTESSVNFDWQRQQRNGIPEVVLAQSKDFSQLKDILTQALSAQLPLFMTRVSPDMAQLLTEKFGHQIIYHALSKTLKISDVYVKNTLVKAQIERASIIGIVAAGTSDLPLVAEVEESLGFLGITSRCHVDIGVAGLWRLTELSDQLNEYPVIVAVAGMEGALFSVVAGLVKAPVIALPSSVGYGVTANGHTALNCALGSCAPGIAVVNIDNGFGAAALAAKMLRVPGLD